MAVSRNPRWVERLRQALICKMATRRDPTERYQPAAELRDDVKRHLAGQPVASAELLDAATRLRLRQEIDEDSTAQKMTQHKKLDVYVLSNPFVVYSDGSVLTC